MPHKVSVRICMGMNCSFRGGLQMLEALEADERIAKRCEIASSRCMDEACRNGELSPVVEIDGKQLFCASLEQVMDRLWERCQESSDA